MKVVVFSLFARTVLLITFVAEPETQALSRRLAALRAWPSRRK